MLELFIGGVFLVVFVLEGEMWLGLWRAMLVPDCIALSLLSLILVENKRDFNMHPHSLCCGFNMKPCIACGQKLSAHTETEAEKQCKHKKQL